MKLKQLICFITLIFVSLAEDQIALNQAAELAADYDSELIVVFLNDFNEGIARYTAYMESNSMTFPQSLIQYYESIATNTDFSFTTALASQFPFEEFQTFITTFPWYSSLIADVKVSTVYAPQDLLETHAYDAVSAYVATAASQLTFGVASGTPSITSPESTSSYIAITASVNNISISARNISSASALGSSSSSNSSSSSSSRLSDASSSPSSTSANNAAGKYFVIPICAWFVIWSSLAFL